MGIVAQLWAPPRCAIWGRLFFCKPFSGAFKSCSICIKRMCILLYAHFPKVSCGRFKMLLAEFTSIQMTVPMQTAVENIAKEVPIYIVQNQIVRALTTAGECAEDVLELTRISYLFAE